MRLSSIPHSPVSDGTVTDREAKPWVLLPVKHFCHAKNRLRTAVQDHYDVSSAELARCMLLDVVHALSQSASIAGIAVVTAEAEVAHLLANIPNIKIIQETTDADLTAGIAGVAEGNLNRALHTGLNSLAADCVQRVVILPADLPLIDVEEFDALMSDLNAQASEHTVGLVASHDGNGTNLLSINPHSHFKLLFGEDSFRLHSVQAQEQGYELVELNAASIRCDIDGLDDVQKLLGKLADQPLPLARHTRQLFQAHVGKRATTSVDHTLALDLPLTELQAQAAMLRDQHFGQVVTYSRKVFIPLTRLCRDVCHYCTFATTPGKVESPYLSVEAVLDIARQGQQLGCKEALITLGEKPELRYRAAREALAEMGFATTIEYIAHVAERVLKETGLLPHINAGCMTYDEFQQLRSVSASMGIMLENVSPRLCEKGQPHYGSPDKDPEVRLRALADAGRAKVPMTTGILIGIGETRQERIDSLLAIKDLHNKYGHIQEVIVQNFVAKQDTKMAQSSEPDSDELLWTVAMARLILGANMSIQVPPNLNRDNLNALIDAGINDWGGVSPLTPDHVNPESPWPHLDQLAAVTAQSGKLLQQRLTVYPEIIHDSEQWLDPVVKPAVLKLVDGQGLARQNDWLSGVSESPDADVKQRVLDRQPLQVSKAIQAILDKLQSDITDTLSADEIAQLFTARGDDFTAVCQKADQLREQSCGDTVSYVINRNINYTNICTYHCSFCAFSKGSKKGDFGDRPYLKTPEEVALLASEAVANGATEVCLQGGIHPAFTGQTYLDICSAVHEAEPDLHIHAFSPLEVWHGAETLNLSVSEFLRRLQAVGLKSLPGTAAEILHDDVRAQICPDKLNTQQWLSVIEAAHQVGLATTATIMFGHVDHYEHWAAHLLAIRDLQRRTGGFTEFVPLSFVAHEAPLYKRGLARRGPTLRESVLMHAVARLVLHGLIDNIQASWVKLGLEGASLCLHAGVNDLGGVLMNESITRAAGARHGQQVKADTLRQAILDASRQPQQRTTLYKTIDRPVNEQAEFVIGPGEIRNDEASVIAV